MKPGFLKSAVSILLLLILLVICAPAALAGSGDTAFTQSENPKLYDILHTTYGLGNGGVITQGEMASLPGTLNLSSQSLTKVDGLQYATAITQLNLSGNSGLTSIAPLADSTMAITSLDLSNTGVSIIPESLEMPALNTLDLSRTPVNDIGLHGLSASNIGSGNTGTNPGLRILKLNKCASLKSIENLKDMSSLYELYMEENSLTSFPADMSNMKELYTLVLKGYTPIYVSEAPGTPTELAAVVNIDKIKTLPKFKTYNAAHPAMLNISNSTLTNGSFLNDCDGLATLFWKYSPKTGLTFPTSAERLTYIDLAYDTHVDNAALQNQISLMTRIQVYDSQYLTATLNITGTGITDVSSLAARTGYSGAQGLGNLYWQDLPALTSANLATLASLKDLSNLKYIDLYNDTGIKNDPGTFYNAITQMTHVTSLGLHDCQIGTVSGLSSMTWLQSLSISYNNLTNIDALSNLTDLRSLSIYCNYVSDLTPLQGLAHLTWLDCGCNYLDTTAGSADMTVMAGLAAAQPGNYLEYGSQMQIEVTYSYDNAKSSAPSPAVQSVYYGQVFTPPVLTPVSGWAFIGWDNDSSNGTGSWDVHSGSPTSVSLPAPVSGDAVTYTAQYSDTAYTVMFDSQAGSAVPAVSTLYGYTINAPAAPTKSGYVFSGWYSDTGLTAQVTFPYVVTGNITFYAKWSPATAYLSGIDLSGGYTVAFSKTKTSYKLNIGENDATITVTPRLENPEATMWIAGVQQSSYTTPVIKNGGSKTVTIKVKYGTKTKTYSLVVKRAKSTDNYLSTLTTNTAETITSFDKKNQTYCLELGENTPSVRIYGTAEAAGLAKVYFSGKLYKLANNQTKTAKIKVKAQSGAILIYTIKIHRAPSTNDSLKSLKTNSSKYPITPAFNASVTEYSVMLPANKSYVTIYAAKADSHATVTINGQNKKSLKVTVPATEGLVSIVDIYVTAQAGGTPRHYIIKIYHLAPV